MPPSVAHEFLIDMVRKKPAVLVELINEVGLSPTFEVPSFRHARVVPGDFTMIAPAEYRADQVVAIYPDGEDSDPVFAFVYEVQLGYDPDKLRSWPVYVATAHARLGCPVALMVMCLDDTVAKRYAPPIRVGEPRFLLDPLVFGPNWRFPTVRDPETARAHPELALLSSLTIDFEGVEHDSGSFRALIAALDQIGPDQAKLYTHLLWSRVSEAARESLERTMVIAEQQGSEFAGVFNTAFDRGEAKGEVKGEVKGKAKAVLTILAARGFDVPDDDRDRIANCTNIAQLDVWVVRAITATSVHDLFA